MKRALNASTLEIAGDVADEVSAAGGGALKAALSGYFAAAGDRSGILLAPLTLLVGGTGAGLRVFDGRARQPGLGGKRPRGFTPDQAIPLAARVAAPQSVAALAIACGYHTGVSLASTVKAGVSAAKQQGAKDRAQLLQSVGSLGASALAHPRFADSWLSEFGPVEGGMATSQDLKPASALDLDAPTAGGLVGTPFVDDAESPEAGRAHLILSVDVTGLFAAIAFRELPSTARLESHEVSVPVLGVPVERGVERLAPGTALPTPVWVEMSRDSAGRIVRIEGRADAEGGARHVLTLSRDPDTKVVTALHG